MGVRAMRELASFTAAPIEAANRPEKSTANQGRLSLGTGAPPVRGGPAMRGMSVDVVSSPPPPPVVPPPPGVPPPLAVVLLPPPPPVRVPDFQVVVVTPVP